MKKIGLSFLFLFVILTFFSSCEQKREVGSDIHVKNTLLAAGGASADGFLQFHSDLNFTYAELDEFNTYVENEQIFVIEPWMNGVITGCPELEKFVFAKFQNSKILRIYDYDIKLGKSKVAEGKETPISKLIRINKLYKSVNVSEEDTLRNGPSYDAAVITFKRNNRTVAPVEISQNYSLSHIERKGDWWKVKVVSPSNSVFTGKEGWIHSSKIDTLRESAVLKMKENFSYTILSKKDNSINVLCEVKNPSSSYLYYLTRYISYKETTGNNRINIFATKEAYDLFPKIEKEMATSKESKYFAKNWLYMKINGTYSYMPAL